MSPVIATSMPLDPDHGGRPSSSSTNHNTNASFSMLFSPAASSLASTPGGPLNDHAAGINNSAAHAGPVELEVDWDPSLVQSELMQASAVLSHRGLKFAAKWAAEQLVGIASVHPMDHTKDDNMMHQHHHHHHQHAYQQQLESLQDSAWSHLTPQDWYAKSLFDLGEYLHAAHVLSEKQSPASSNSASTTTTATTANISTNTMVDILQLGGPLPTLSSFGVYLRAYSLYLAGERRKEEEYLELESDSQKQPKTRNPYLIQLMAELEQAYQRQQQQQQQHDDDDEEQPVVVLDAFGLYVYGLVLKEAQAETLTCPRPPHTVLMESLLQFPYNWSAWLDLCDVLAHGNHNNHNNNNSSSSSSSTMNHHMDHPHGMGNPPPTMTRSSVALEQQVEQVLQPTLATHYMYHFFCAHLLSHHHQAHEDALVLYDRLYEPLPDGQSLPLFATSYLKTQMGVVHYHLREFEQALEWFHQIQDPFLLDQKDIYSNILYVREDKVALSQLAHQASRIDKYRPETCCIIGNYYSLKQKRHKAVLYFQRALKLDRHYTSAWTLMGHEYVELKQTESAMEAYRRAVTVSTKDYRAWYGLGQTYELLNMHLYALFYYRKAAVLRPYDARMWCAVGLCLVALHKVPDAIRAYERAVAQEDTEGIATQKLAALYRQEGRQEEAAQCYVRHLELRYLVTHPSPQTATTTSLNAAGGTTPPSLDAIVQGVVVEAPEAEALFFLAQYHKTHGQYDTAALLCSRLVEYPGPEKEQAKGLLRDLRARAGRRYAAPSSSTRMMTETEDVVGTGKDSNTSAFEFSP